MSEKSKQSLLELKSLERLTDSSDHMESQKVDLGKREHAFSSGQDAKHGLGHKTNSIGETCRLLQCYKTLTSYLDNGSL